METIENFNWFIENGFGSYPTYEEWKQVRTYFIFGKRTPVLILPMRNGNRRAFDLGGLYIEVLILPMRNGNSVLVTLIVVFGIRSYPTYEEWKLKLIYILCQRIFFCSYPTYEEWKQYNPLDILETLFQVLILPMRNGNPFSNIHLAPCNAVLILPMRNGN